MKIMNLIKNSKPKFLFQAVLPTVLSLVCTLSLLAFAHWQVLRFSDLKSQFDVSQQVLLSYSLLRQSTEILSERLQNSKASLSTIQEQVFFLESYYENIPKSEFDSIGGTVSDKLKRIQDASKILAKQDSSLLRKELLATTRELRDLLGDGFANVTMAVDLQNSTTYQKMNRITKVIERIALVTLLIIFFATLFLYRNLKARISRIVTQLGQINLLDSKTFSAFSIGPNDELQVIETHYQSILDRLHESLAETSRERAFAAHTAKLASLGEMSAGVAHEINNPLAIIRANIPLLVKFKDQEAKFLSKAEQIEKSVTRIEKIVKGLKKFSRASTGNEYKLENLNEIFSEVQILTDAKSRRHDVSVEMQIESGLMIFCDGVEIEQVLVNLINNSVDAIKANSEKWVKVHAFSLAGSITIRVIDAGPGISVELENKLFQPFFTTKPVGEGTGLGLSITKGILEQHKAQININRDYKNTCFELRFPKPEENARVA